MSKVQFSAVLKNRVGLHARPAALFVRTAKKYRSDILVEKSGKKADAKKILGVLGLGAEKGDKITVYIDGPDAEEVKEILHSMIQDKFGED
ncbi:MAG: HPr family phosphocarrier protein [Candidatus Hodarchaeota archaeon]